MGDAPYVRYQATRANARGIFPGVFALVNGLYFAGELSDAQVALRREVHDWFNANLTNPADVDEGVFDRTRNPITLSWFKASAWACFAKLPTYLTILDAHGIGYERVSSYRPGRIVYEDALQVVAVPAKHAARD
jgi:hypothetical protein